MFLLVYWVWT